MDSNTYLFSDEIVVVDDAYETLILLSELLQKQGFNVKTIDNGQDALDYIVLNPPSLILLDIMMPNVDGFEVCSRLKENETTRIIPVIFISALEDNGTRLNGFKIGGVDYITKPFYKDEVLARVRSHYSLFQLQLNLKEKNHILESEISSRKNTEKSLLKYKMGIENTDDAIFITDIHGIIEYINPAFINIYGYSMPEIIGQSPKILHAEIPTDNDYVQYWDKLSLKKPFKGEVPNKTKDGTLVYVENSQNPILDEKNKLIGFISINKDVTSQKVANEVFLKLSQSVEQSPSIVMITDTEGNIEYVNPKFTENTGYIEEEVLGKNPRFLKSDKLDPIVYKELWKTISSGNVWRGELINTDKNGNLQWEWATIAPLRNADGEIINYIATKEDVSIRKKMEVDLIEAKEKAEENDRLKSAFLANMSHEIRTPLNSIIGFSEMLADPDFEPSQHAGFAEIIYTAGNSLLSIISDIMDISKIEASQVMIIKEPFLLKEFLLLVKKEFLGKAEKCGLELKLNTKGLENIIVNNDEIRLHQILNNIMGNAIKFTEEGTVEFGANVSDSSVNFFVKDTGIGIAPEYHEMIFERFRQVDNSHTRKYGGNGLGLSISKSLIGLLEGQISLESEPGKGSTFYFSIPNK